MSTSDDDTQAPPAKKTRRRMRNKGPRINGVHNVKLVRGGNAPITASTVTVILEWGSQCEVDPQALLLTEAG
ncbi:hypothetical protein ACLMAJ_29335, partial [Nocardia sp. KC 131]|uniref:hypothetical protein n=1 Tax=Nocardia arseniciresistens TaxID=3392119 RepID=UPI00398F0D80